MKKVLLLSITALLFLSACKKTIIEESSIVYIDEPPKEMWGSNQVYKQTGQGFLTAKEVNQVESRGYYCNQWLNTNSGQWNTYDCGNYYLIQMHDYYGLYKGKIYVSRSKKTVSIFGTLLLNAQEAIKKKGEVIVDQCTPCWNPLGATTSIAWVY